jgi:hypothetical protein
MIQLHDCSFAVTWRDYRVEWLTPSEQSFSCIMEITELLSDGWHQVSNRSAVSWWDYRVAYLVLITQLCNLSMIQVNDCSLGVNNHSTLISPWYTSTIAVGVNNYSTLQSLHDTAEQLLTWCQQSLNNSVISPWYSWTIAHLMLTSCIMERLELMSD